MLIQKLILQNSRWKSAVGKMNETAITNRLHNSISYTKRQIFHANSGQVEVEKYMYVKYIKT
jgi:hypothetical protein